jgi:4-hydroxyacetophenone monooxygenase
MSAVDPIAEDDAFIQQALSDAEIPALLPALAQVTGNMSLLREDLRPDPSDLLGAQGGLSDEQLEAARREALLALTRFRDEGCRPVPTPSQDRLREIMQFVAGPAMDDYLPLLSEELGLAGDATAPAWRMDSVAPDSGFSVVVIGAGMSGLVAGHRLQQAGIPYVIVEKNPEVGGTWYENVYPGCRVDVANHLFSYSFAQKHDWPEHFSTQDVLLSYFREFAEEQGLYEHIRFRTEVLSADFSDVSGKWMLRLRTPEGSEEALEANAVITAVGQLNRPHYPEIPGQDGFEGPSFHSAGWDRQVDLAGKRIGVIGTGASAIQFIPIIAEQAAEVLIFQRTAPWLAPTPDYHDRVAPGQAWLLRHVPYYSAWYRFWLFCTYAEGLLSAAKVDPEWQGGNRSVSAENEALRQGLTAYLDEAFSDRPDLLPRVIPDYPPAAKRMLRDNGIWARTLKRDNVKLITDPIEQISCDAINTRSQGPHQVDVIVYATGFQASRFLLPMAIRGKGGVDLHEQWAGDARAYLGLTVPGFPNLFCLYGPNTNIVVNGSIIFFSECSVGYILDSLRHLLEGKHRTMEVSEDVYCAYNKEIDDANRLMSWGASSVHSWYKNERGRVTQNWPFTLREYWARTKVCEPADYNFNQ